MSESSSEKLIPPSQTTLNGIWDRVASLTKDGKKLEYTEVRTSRKEESDGHIVTLSALSEIGERLDPDNSLATIVIRNPPNKPGENLSYDLYKDQSGKKRIERNKPPPSPKKDIPKGRESFAEIVADLRKIGENVSDAMKDQTIRRFWGLSAIGEPEAQELLARLNALR